MKWYRRMYFKTFEWYRDIDDPYTFACVECFADADAGAAHMGTAHVKQFMDRAPDLVSAQPEIVYVENFAEVPAAAADAEVDPNWLQLRANALLPAFYMPPTMNGRRSVPIRFAATILIAMFLFATSVGVCLTYGPPGT